MSLSSRLALHWVGLALLSGVSAAAAGNSVATAPAAPKIARAVAPALSLPAFDVTSETLDPLWTPLPSRFASSSASGDMMRIEWDRESRSWGPASTAWSSPLGAGIFGARLPSDRPVQVTRADGSVMLMLGPESMEFAFAQRGPDGRFHWSCGPESHVDPAVTPLEDR